MKKINLILRKCKTLSRQLGRTSSYSSLRSKSSRRIEDDIWGCGDYINNNNNNNSNGRRQCHSCVTIFVGSSRRRYVISSNYLNHPLLNALIEKSKQKKPAGGGGGDPDNIIFVKCEVVLFDHLLWMLENGDPNLSSDSLEELAELYVF